MSQLMCDHITATIRRAEAEGWHPDRLLLPGWFGSIVEPRHHWNGLPVDVHGGDRITLHCAEGEVWTHLVPACMQEYDIEQTVGTAFDLAAKAEGLGGYIEDEEMSHIDREWRRIACRTMHVDAQERMAVAHERIMAGIEGRPARRAWMPPPVPRWAWGLLLAAGWALIAWAGWAVWQGYRQWTGG